MRGLAVVAAFLVGLVAALLGAYEAGVHASLDRLERAIAGDVRVERARREGRRLPPLRGQPLPKNMAPLIEAARESISGDAAPHPPPVTVTSATGQRRRVTGEAALAFTKEPPAPVPGWARAWVEKHRADAAKARAALAAERCDWRTVSGRQRTDPASIWTLVRLVILEGHARALAGEAAPAAEAYVDAAAVAVALVERGPWEATRAYEVAAEAVSALARIASTDLPQEHRALLAGELRLLEMRMPETADLVRWERLEALDDFLAIARGGHRERWFWSTLPREAAVALDWPGFDEHHRRVESACRHPIAGMRIARLLGLASDPDTRNVLLQQGGVAPALPTEVARLGFAHRLEEVRRAVER